MKNTFKEFARPKSEDLKKLWDSAVIILDTNVLLNLYAYSEKTRNEVFKILEKLKKQLWLPYKVCEEFYTKRISIIDTSNHKNDKIIDYIEDLLNIDKESCLYGLFHNNKDLKKLKDDAQKILKQSELDIFHDKILDRIEDIYNGRVGKDFTEEEKNSIKEDYNNKIKAGMYCPGHKDAGKNSNAYGDLILWRQILDYAKKGKINIIFVTEDGKTDWWWKPRDIRISARYELLKEFIEYSDGGVFYMYNFKGFTDDFEKYKNTKVDDKVQKEIKETSVSKIMERILSDNKVLSEQRLEELTRCKSNFDTHTKIYDALTAYEKSISRLSDSNFETSLKNNLISNCLENRSENNIQRLARYLLEEDGASKKNL